MSRYLKAFQTALQKSGDLVQLLGDDLLVEEIKPPEVKTASGLIMASGTKAQIDGVEHNRPCFVRVLAVGAGYYDDGVDVPLDSKPGDIVLVALLSVAWFSAFGDILTHEKDSRIGRIKENSIAMRFRGQQAYDDFFAALKSELANVQ